MGRICAAYCLAALTAALGWLYSSLPDHISLEPGQALALPRFAYIQPMGGSGARNVASTRTAGSYQATLSIGGVLPVKTVRAVITAFVLSISSEYEHVISKVNVVNGSVVVVPQFNCTDVVRFTFVS